MSRCLIFIRHTFKTLGNSHNHECRSSCKGWWIFSKVQFHQKLHIWCHMLRLKVNCFNLHLHFISIFLRSSYYLKDSHWNYLTEFFLISIHNIWQYEFNGLSWFYWRLLFSKNQEFLIYLFFLFTSNPVLMVGF